MSDDRAPRYMEGDTVVYRASALGMCEVALAAYGLGHEGDAPPEWMQERYREGQKLEGQVLDKLLTEYGRGLILFASAQEEVELDIGEINGRRVIVRGHVDGKGTTVERDVVVEVKALSPSMYEKAAAQGLTFHDAYSWQGSIYMHATGMGLVWAASEKLTVDASREDIQLGRLHVQVVNDPPIRLSDIKRRVARVEATIESGRLPDCSGVQFPCPMYKLHTADEKAWGTADETLRSLCQQYQVAVDGEKAFGKTKKELAAGIKKWFVEREVDKCVVMVDGVEYVATRVVSEVPEVLTKAHTRDYVTVSPRRKAKKDDQGSTGD